jgi:hypothetical protein
MLPREGNNKNKGFNAILKSARKRAPGGDMGRDGSPFLAAILAYPVQPRRSHRRALHRLTGLTESNNAPR